MDSAWLRANSEGSTVVTEVVSVSPKKLCSSRSGKSSRRRSMTRTGIGAPEYAINRSDDRS